MNWEAIAAVAEILAAIGVILSLAYLAIQIRQNTSALRNTSYHQAAEQTWNASLMVASDPELSSILTRAMAGESLSPDESSRISVLHVSLLYGYENLLRMHEQELLDPDTWENVIENSGAYLDNPVTREFLRQRRGPLSRRLLALLESRSVAD